MAAQNRLRLRLDLADRQTGSARAPERFLESADAGKKANVIHLITFCADNWSYIDSQNDASLGYLSL